MSHPLSDHFDGHRFHNPTNLPFPDAPPPTSTPNRRGSILRWQFGLRPKWPVDRPTSTYPDAPPPEPGELVATFVNHSTFLLSFGRHGKAPLTVLTDPIFSERCSPFRHLGPRRVQPPGLSLDALPRIDVVAVSHCHYDHMDLPTLRFLAERDDPACITPLGNRRHLRKAGLTQIVEQDWWEHAQLGDLGITLTPARHATARTPFDANEALWAGFLFTLAGNEVPSVFFVGDSGHGRHWAMIRERLGAPDLALLPIGAYEPRDLMRRVHVNPEEAFEAFRNLGAKRGLGMHFGTFQLTDEGIDEPPARLRLATRAAGLPDDTFDTLGNGESRLFSRNAVSQPDTPS
ncbi:hypothetical protein NCH01_25710 [Neoasaia chiangmaiensis]|uniref:Uncharacterized protein n=1 Tax=Neoasaia chiangmaiensis TaxID=320497 RepID=A0A1U9KNK4_9PROT|nr:MBL fold metallo-hydrolase [Neoasaia chiangmaiensis]AQS87376.1 hypothetical protein A0U93_04850 [Neoasaia chiangmaiensis]GEN16140.1 hypothetical protein NCH01_25710 [Neoasaia chiangmaiensis]